MNLPYDNIEIHHHFLDNLCLNEYQKCVEICEYHHHLMLLSQLWPKGQKMRPKVAELGQNEAKFADLKFHTLFSQKNKTQTKWGWQFQIAISIKRRYMSSS